MNFQKHYWALGQMKSIWSVWAFGYRKVQQPHRKAALWVFFGPFRWLFVATEYDL